MRPSRYPKNIAPVAEAFESQATLLKEQFDKNSRRKPLSPFDSAWGAFKRESYALIRGIKGSPGGHNVVKHIVTLAGVEPARLYYKGNEFHWGLLAIDPELEILDRKRVSRFARQMAYADLHGVHPNNLVGFLYQSGSAAAVTRKLADNAREPWFGKALPPSWK